MSNCCPPPVCGSETGGGGVAALLAIIALGAAAVIYIQVILTALLLLALSIAVLTIVGVSATLIVRRMMTRHMPGALRQAVAGSVSRMASERTYRPELEAEVAEDGYYLASLEEGSQGRGEVVGAPVQRQPQRAIEGVPVRPGQAYSRSEPSVVRDWVRGPFPSPDKDRGF